MKIKSVAHQEYKTNKMPPISQIPPLYATFLPIFSFGVGELSYKNVPEAEISHLHGTHRHHPASVYHTKNMAKYITSLVAAGYHVG